MADRTPVFKGTPQYVTAFEANPAKLAERLRVVEKRLDEIESKLKVKANDKVKKDGTDTREPVTATAGKI